MRKEEGGRKKMDLTEKKSKRGRPTNYTIELAHEICKVVATTSKGIKALCRDNPTWPNPDTIFSWIIQLKEFSDQYARAKRIQIEVMIDEVLEIADDTSSDTVISEGKTTTDHEHINRSKLRIDTRKWLASKLCPRLYGDKDEHVNLKFPTDITDSSSLIKMSSEVFRALASEEISPAQARTLVATVKDHATNIVIGNLNERLTELELENTTNNHTTIEGK